MKMLFSLLATKRAQGFSLLGKDGSFAVMFLVLFAAQVSTHAHPMKTGADCHFELQPNTNPLSFDLKGVVFEKITNAPLSEVHVKVINIRNGFSKELLSDINGEFSARLMGEAVYNIIVLKERHYAQESYTISTIGRQAGENLTLSISMLALVTERTFSLEKVSFEINAPNLLASSNQELDDIYLMLMQNPDLVVEVGCHTDARGDDYHNLELSQKQALAVVDYLMEKGISNLRVKAKGYGETQPTNHCKNGVKCSSSQHIKNRRVEVKVLGFLE